MPLQIRRGTEAERQLLASPLQEGELVYITDTQQLYVGDGTNLLKNISPITGYTDENAVDAAGQALTSGTHTGITFTYSTTQDAADRIDAAINPTQNLTTLTVSGNTSLAATTINGTLTVSGKLIADFNGSIHADDSTLLVDGVDAKINLDGTVKGNIIPDADEAYDIGSSSLKFKDLYLSGSSLWLGAAQLTSTGPVFNLPAGSTIDGQVIQSEVSEEESFVRDLQGSVFGDDSTKIIDALDNTVNAQSITLLQGQINVGVASLKINDATSVSNVVLTQYAPVPGDTNKIFAVVDDTAGPGLITNASRGSILSPTTLQTEDSLYSEYTFGHDGSDYTISTGIIHAVDPSGTVSSGVMPGTLLLGTYNDGNIENVRGIRINRNGNVTINKGLDYDATAALDVEGDVVINGQIDLKDLTTTAGAASGEVDLTTSTVAESWLKIKVGGVEYAIPLHALNP